MWWCSYYKILKEGLIANRISKVQGVLNGTSNYILTSMYKDKLSFQKALKKAQDLGTLKQIHLLT